MFAFLVGGQLLAFVVVGVLLLLGLTFLVPRRSWPCLLLIGCPVLALWPLALAALKE